MLSCPSINITKGLLKNDSFLQRYSFLLNRKSSALPDIGRECFLRLRSNATTRMVETAHRNIPSADIGFRMSLFKGSFDKAAIYVLRAEKRRIDYLDLHGPTPPILSQNYFPSALAMYQLVQLVHCAKATFWPLLGIAIELAILAAFILVYERNRRIKKSKPQSPTMNDGQTSVPRKSSRESG
ncbi:hypothetical protein ACTXT7_000448 [Hymenolepis weldensis]